MKLSKLYNNFRYILGLPKSIYVNFRLLSFKNAIKLPIIVSHKTKFTSLSGKVILNNPKTGIIRIGFGSIQMLDFSYNRTILHIDGTVEFNGKCKIGQGSRIEIGSNGHLIFGNNFISSGQTKIICHKEVNIGANCLFAWDSLLMDTDYHRIYDQNNNIINENKKITIADNVWINTRVTILKGATVASGCIVAANALISKPYNESNCILAKNPAVIIKKNISWHE